MSTTRIDVELTRLSEIELADFRRDLEAAIGEIPALYRGRGRAPIRLLTRAVREYWQACLEPYWPRMRSVLYADIVYRGRRMALHGLPVMLNELGPTMKVQGRMLSIRLRASIDRTEPVGPAGLTLTPTLFTRGASVPITPGAGASIMYVARGQGAMWGPVEAPRSGATVALLGAPRATLLRLLEEPRSTTSLAESMQVTPSAVSQHLRVLREAGLVSAARHGRSVLYFRSELGDALVGARQAGFVS